MPAPTEATRLARARAEARALARRDFSGWAEASLGPSSTVSRAESCCGQAGVETRARREPGAVATHHVPERAVTVRAGGVVALAVIDDDVVLVDAVDHVVGLAGAASGQECRSREDDNRRCCDVTPHLTSHDVPFLSRVGHLIVQVQGNDCPTSFTAVISERCGVTSCITVVNVQVLVGSVRGADTIQPLALLA